MVLRNILILLGVCAAVTIQAAAIQAKAEQNEKSQSDESENETLRQYKEDITKIFKRLHDEGQLDKIPEIKKRNVTKPSDLVSSSRPADTSNNFAGRGHCTFTIYGSNNRTMACHHPKTLNCTTWENSRGECISPFDFNRYLMYNAYRGNLNAVESLLEAGADPNYMEIYWLPEQGWSVLMQAAASGHIDVVKKLLHVGADVNTRNSDGGTALMEAAQHERLEIIKLLIEAGAELEARDSHGGNTALLLAVKDRKLKAAELLIELGANVNAKDGDGSTALLKVVYWRPQIDMIKLLLDAGAHTWVRTRSGKNIKQMASVHNDASTQRKIKKLIDAQRRRLYRNHHLDPDSI